MVSIINLFPPFQFCLEAKSDLQAPTTVSAAPIQCACPTHAPFWQVPLISSDQLPSDNFQCSLCRCRASGFKVRTLALSSHHLQRSVGNGCQEQPSDLRHVLTAKILLYLHKEEGYNGCYTDSGITMISYLQCRA